MFGGVAAQFVLLAAEFVAVTQILVYIGAIMVLMLFGIMLTRARIGRDVYLTHDYWHVGALTGVLLAAVMGYSLLDAFGDDPLPAEREIATVAGSNTSTTMFSSGAVSMVGSPDRRRAMRSPGRATCISLAKIIALRVYQRPFSSAPGRSSPEPNDRKR